MKLYFSRGACSLACRIVINELGQPCEFVSVNLQTKTLDDGFDYIKINPKGAVPALLTEEQEVLTENAVIQQYLADSAKAYHLLPPLGDFKRYRVLEWLNYITTELHKGFSPLFNPNYPQAIKDSITIPALMARFKFINAKLKPNEFLMGQVFTLPDGYLFVMLLWAQMQKLELSEFKNLGLYYTKLKARESVQKAMKDEGLEKYLSS